MIKRFHVLYVGQVELENIGLQGTPADARRYDNAKLSEPFFAARDVAQLMDDLGYHALWTAEHHFQHEGYECFPESDPALAVARHADAPPQDRLRVQRASHVASHPHRGGLRDGGHRHRRPGDHGRGPRLSLARGRDVRRAGHRSGRQPRAVRGAGRPDAEVLQRGVVQPPRQALRLPARRGVSRPPAHRDHVRAAAEASARRDLDAHREQQVDRLHGVEGLQGDDHAQRGEDPR